MVYFPGSSYRSHTSCMTEDQKYQGALYKPKRQKHEAKQAADPQNNMAHNAYVEDVTEGYEAYRDYEIRESDDDGQSPADLPPEAPTPPSAADANLNVFDFLVDATPNASNVNLQPEQPPVATRQLVRFDDAANDYVDPTGYMIDDDEMVQYGSSAIPYTYETPAPKTHRKKSKDSEVKKDKKRKRLHIETSPAALDVQPGDEVMTDAPPVLHSGLTGGLKSMMRPSQFPPSPDYSGGDAGEISPASPIKKSKHTKPAKPTRTDSLGSTMKALMSGSSKSTKVSKKRKHSSERKEKKKRRHHRSSSDKASSTKMIEYRSKSGDEKEGESGTMIIYKPRSDLFLSFCNKGPESDRGCSVNKTLKRFHRERTSTGNSLGKVMEEKELWRSLRMRRNDRGEIVLFSIDED
ncbi:LYAR-type C2HC zinc finger protein [Xylariaceae sp. FL0016]|nr:LYAR-type C2HC zinc finger protein [Xylariaceae sp. FL0016]